MNLFRLGLPDALGVSLHRHPPTPARYTVVMTWVTLVKGHFAAEQHPLEIWMETSTQDSDFMARAQP
jgi:hypothetical protein